MLRWEVSLRTEFDCNKHIFVELVFILIRFYTTWRCFIFFQAISLSCLIFAILAPLPLSRKYLLLELFYHRIFLAYQSTELFFSLRFLLFAWRKGSFQIPTQFFRGASQWIQALPSWIIVKFIFHHSFALKNHFDWRPLSHDLKISL